MFDTCTQRRVKRLILLSGLVMLLAACSTAGATIPTASIGAPTLAPQTTSAPAPATSAPAPATSAPATSAPAPASAQPAQASDVLSATQTLLGYYAAIDARDYARAYAVWEAGASGQTFEQFQQGFAETREVDVTVGTPSDPQGAAGSIYIDIPLTIIAGTDSDVQQFSGTYTLRRSNVSGGDPNWKLYKAQIAPVTVTAVQQPKNVLQAYYDAINTRAYAAAFTRWGHIGTSSKQTLIQFAQGFAATTQVAVQYGKVTQDAGAGSAFANIPVLITATQADTSVQSYCGTYTLRHVNVVGGGKMPWRIQQAQVAPINVDGQMDNDTVQRLLDNNCKP